MLAFQIAEPGGEGQVVEVPKPQPQPGQALIRVLRAGICNTDLEIWNGYMDFTGILGHEFVSVVEAVASDDDKEWMGIASWATLMWDGRACAVCEVQYDDKC